MAEAIKPAGSAPPAARQSLVVGGASLGTLFEWYDFFIYGALAGLIARHFFTGVSEAMGFIFALTVFAAGFAVRPFGALVFGRLGDMIGRKRTFIATMAIMGMATFLIGLLPGTATLGIAAPVLLVILRMLQGLAVGGEYGGAAIYVAEHAPADRRGYLTSWINATATAGLILSLGVVILVRMTMSEADFADYGWRVPFLLSIVLLAISLWIRMKLGESPVFEQMKAEDTISKAPFSEAFGRWENLRWVLLVIAVGSGGTTIWYTGTFYVLFFLERVLKVEGIVTNELMMIALAIATPTYILFGWFSDRIGRKPLVLGCLALGAVSLFPTFSLLTQAANPALALAQANAPVVLKADPASCSVQLNPVGSARYDERGCDIAKAYLASAGVSYRNVSLPEGAATELHVGGEVIQSPDPAGTGADDRAASVAAFHARAVVALSEAGYPAAANSEQISSPLVIAIVAYLVFLGAMGFAPMAAFLVELFPARIRYTSLSFPYHLTVGWIGGFLPATAFAIVAQTGDIYSGLWYPVGFSIFALIVGLMFMPETRGRSISA